MVTFSAGSGGIDPAVFTGLQQTYLVTRTESGQLHTTVAEGIAPCNLDDSFQFAGLPSSEADSTTFDGQSVYLLAWQTPSVTATLTGFSDGVVVESATVEVGNDPTQITVNWDAIDQLAITYTGTPGFPVTDNFLFL
jgi:hypothetical protein